MYPNLYYAVKDLFGIEINGLKLINSFGFFVAIAFISASAVLSAELKRKEKEGLLIHEEEKIIVGDSICNLFCKDSLTFNEHLKSGFLGKHAECLHFHNEDQYEQLEFDFIYNDAQLSFDFQEDDNISIENKNKKYFALIKINPTTNPIVKLEPIQSELFESSDTLGKMNFLVDVSSTIPLTLVELSVRTQSGYHFDKALAEFWDEVKRLYNEQHS